MVDSQFMIESMSVAVSLSAGILAMVGLIKPDDDKHYTRDKAYLLAMIGWYILFLQNALDMSKYL